jgi:hypothetical protein
MHVYTRRISYRENRLPLQVNLLRSLSPLYLVLRVSSRGREVIVLSVRHS